MKIRIATRTSPLALYQACYIKEQLIFFWPHLEIEYVPLSTTGDRFLETKLKSIGGKGLFVKELELALQQHQADIAVHSMKDVPSLLPDDLILQTICTRELPFDAFVSQHYTHLDKLPQKASVGTSSLRRQAQLLSLRPDLTINMLRGNVGTRLKKLKQGQYDAIILAEAGLTRLGLAHEIKQRLAPPMMIPAVGQGALGIECRTKDSVIQALLAPLHNPIDALCVGVERQINQLLGGGCHSSVGIYCCHKDNLFHLYARITHPKGLETIEYQASAAEADLGQLANDCASFFLSQQGDRFLYE